MNEPSGPQLEYNVSRTLFQLLEKHELTGWVTPSVDCNRKFHSNKSEHCVVPKDPFIHDIDISRSRIRLPHVQAPFEDMTGLRHLRHCIADTLNALQVYKNTCMCYCSTVNITAIAFLHSLTALTRASDGSALCMIAFYGSKPVRSPRIRRRYS